ncbi:NUDIX domain-containing protein [Frankia tisae]|uniref:NUDIX domain-containing protein n=1 Tax=Frankia tisae TaxID=2950104 RepID=UPI0021BE48FB|nr:NUDIX hydrolase [Frankia tisae]
MRVVRRAARAILIDSDGRLVLFRRTLPKRKPYWSTPGGGVDREDGSVEAALHRELAEELGATVDRVQQVFLTSPPRGDGIAVSHFFVCRLVSMDLSKRTGEEFTNPAKGRYDVERIDLHGKKLNRYALQPPEVKEFILANRQALLVAALTDDAPPLTLADDPAAAAAVPPTRSETATGSAEAPAADGTSATDQPVAPGDAGAAEPARPSGRAPTSPEDGTFGEPPASAEAIRPGQGTTTGQGTTAGKAVLTDKAVSTDETVSTDQAGMSDQATATDRHGTAGDATLSQHAGSGDVGAPDDGSPAPSTMNAGNVAERRRRAMPPILEIVDGAVVNDGSDPPTQALPRPRRWPRWPFRR